MREVVIALSLAVMSVPAFAAPAAAPAPEALLKAGPAIAPLLQKDRPWALVESPAAVQVQGVLRELSRVAAGLGEAVSVFSETLSEASEAQGDALEHRLAFLVQGLPVEAARADELTAAFGVLAGLKPESFRAGPARSALRGIAAELAGAAADATDLAAETERLESLHLGGRAGWSAARTLELARDLAWRASRAAEAVKALEPAGR